MFMKWLKCLSTVGLILGVFWSPVKYHLLLELVVSISAIMIFRHAFRTQQYTWAIGFAAIAMLLNPIQSVSFYSGMFYRIAWLSVGMFLLSLAMLNRVKHLTLQSIATPLPILETL